MEEVRDRIERKNFFGTPMLPGREHIARQYG